MRKYFIIFLIFVLFSTGCKRFNSYWDKAMYYYNKGKYEKAIKYFKLEAKNVISRRDQSFYMIGKSFLKLKEYNKAKEYFDFISKPKDSDQIVTTYMDALWNFNGGQYSQAYDKLKGIISISPTYKNGKAYYFYLRALSHLKSLQETLNEISMGIKILQPYLSEKNIVNFYNLYAKFLIQAKDYKKAIEYLKKVLVINDDFLAHYNLGICYENLKDYENAKIHYFQSYILGNYDLAKWKYFELCSLNDVKEHLDIFGFKKTAFDLFVKGIENFKKGNFEYFRYYVQKALKKDPKIERLFYQWGHYQLLFNQNELFKANILHYVMGKGKEASLLYEKLPKSYCRDLNWGILLVKAGKFDKALSLLNNLSKGSHDQRKYFYLALMYLNKNNMNKTIQYLKKAKKIDKNIINFAYFQNILRDIKDKKIKNGDKLLNFIIKNSNDKEVLAWIRKNMKN